jgi:integrase
MGKRAHGEGTITQRKDGTWMGQISVGHKPDGSRDRRTVYSKTQKEVRAKVDEIKQQLAAGTLSDTKLTVKAYLERWLKETALGLKASTLEQYEYCVLSHIVPRVGQVRLDKLTPLQAQAMVSDIVSAIQQRERARRQAKGESLEGLERAGVSTANKCRVVLFMAYKQAIRWQMVARNPVEAVDPLPESPREMQLWEAAQAARFLDVAREHRLYAAFYVAMAGGLRRGELLGLRWQDVEDSLLHIRQTLVKKATGELVSQNSAKTEKGKRVIAVSPDVVAVLELHRQLREAERHFLRAAWQDGDLVFTSEVGTPVNPDNLRRLRT